MQKNLLTLIKAAIESLAAAALRTFAAVAFKHGRQKEATAAAKNEEI